MYRGPCIGSIYPTLLGFGGIQAIILSYSANSKLSPKLQPSAAFPMGYIRSLAHIDSPIHQSKEHDDSRRGWQRPMDSMVLGLVRRASKVHLAEPSWEQPQALKMQQPLIICLSVPL